MADYADAKHRDHAIHTGEVPENTITEGPRSLRVTLDRWGPVEGLFTSMYDALQANWGDFPSRTVHRGFDGNWTRATDVRVPEEAMAVHTGWAVLTDSERDYIEMCFAGKTLQQVLEGITFDFCIDGVSRAFTHQNVRTRLGAGFMQHGGRDNDWRHRPWTMPETIRRMCVTHESSHRTAAGFFITNDNQQELKHCITDWGAIFKYLNELPDNTDGFSMPTIREAIDDHIMRCRVLYSALVDAGIPWQDARRVLPIGMQTYIHDQYNYLALSGVLANRLEHIMDWEFNCVAQLMLREIKMKCPPLLSKYLGSHSDKAGRAKFAGLESWPPDRKYPSPYDICDTCAHSIDRHTPIQGSTESQCSACEAMNQEAKRSGRRVHSDPPLPSTMHTVKLRDTLPRQNRREQNPFFVLAPAAMAGGPIEWISTNGEYPHEKVK